MFISYNVLLASVIVGFTCFLIESIVKICIIRPKSRKKKIESELDNIYEKLTLSNMTQLFPNTCSHIKFKDKKEWVMIDISQKDYCYIDEFQRVRIGDGVSAIGSIRSEYFGIYKIKIKDKPIQVYYDILSEHPKYQIPVNSIVLAVQDKKIMCKFYVIGCMNLYMSRKTKMKFLGTGYINGWDSMSFERM